jgi:DNA-binding transcriptional regulator YiaG
MNTLLNPSTSAREPMRSSDLQSLSSSRFYMLPDRTASIGTSNQRFLAHPVMTNSGIPLPSASPPELTQKAVNELRRLSGLTWEQLAKLFNVSRRSIHSWASGERLKSFNEENLYRLLDTIRYINRGSASLNRSLLLQPINDGRSLLDLLVAGQHEEVKQILGFGNAPKKPNLGDLSEEEHRLRMPLPPDVLANPLPDISYYQTGRSKPAKAARSRRNSSDQ